MANIGATELANWTPIAIHLDADEPAVEWADLRPLRFTDAFFDDTVERWRKDTPGGRIVTTGLDALVTLDQAPSLDPDGVVFHMSRCGSTLVARLLQRLPDCIVVSEPNCLNAVVDASDDLIDDETRARLLRLVVRALGRRRFGNERQFVVKPSSWTIRKLPLFRRAFPDTPMVWLQRAPAEVLASLMANHPEWLTRREQDDAPSALASVLAELLQAASQAETLTTVDYTELPDAVWTTIAPLFGILPPADKIAEMRAQAALYSKADTPRRFERTAVETPDEARRLAASLEPPYRALKARAGPAPRRSGS